MSVFLVRFSPEESKIVLLEMGNELNNLLVNGRGGGSWCKVLYKLNSRKERNRGENGRTKGITARWVDGMKHATERILKH